MDPIKGYKSFGKRLSLESSAIPLDVTPLRASKHFLG
jgi:hypothetical protein